MRTFREEFGHEYATYRFGYCEYAEIEPGDDTALAYEQGYLPASADPSVHNRFYMARSVRVDVSAFTPSSENRRVLKKFDGLFTVDFLSQEELQQDAGFKECFLTYFKEQHGERVMSAERLEGILHTVLPLRAVRYAKDGEEVGYVLEVAHGALAHYWFSCFTKPYTHTSCGMWLMIDAVRRAKDEGRTHLYLGTAYGEKGRYKLNFAPLEFWSGTHWITEERALKALIRKD